MRSFLLLAALLGACTVDAKYLSGDGAPPDAGPDSGVDMTAPETTIDEAPAGVTNVDAPTFHFSSNEASATFACSVDGAEPTPCESPVSLSLDDGPHTFAVRATDGAGNQDDTPAEHVWTIDTVAPETTIGSAPPSVDNSVDVSFEFTAAETVQFACSVDGGAYAACTSPRVLTGLADGVHTFAVRATDVAGNVEASAASHSWSIDTSSPDTAIDEGPSGSVADASASFEFSSPDAGASASFECSLDGSQFVACTSPRAFNGLAEAQHAFEVRVRDGVGNTDPTPARRVWTVDLTSPDTSIVNGPSGATASTSATFTFGSNESGVTYECALDTTTHTACATPYQQIGLGQGAHTLSIRAVDAAGNRDATPVSRTWTVDTVAPDTSIVSGPSAMETTALATFDFSSTESGATFQCALDSESFATCADPVSLSVADGSHTLAVRARDAAGNTDATPASHTWAVDTSGPQVQIIYGPTNGSTTGPYAEFFFQATPATTTTCSLDGGAFTACSPGTTIGFNVPPGPHTYTIRATNAQNQVGEAMRSWTVACGAATATATTRGLFHMDEASGQTVDNAVASYPDAVLGTTSATETSDPARVSGGRFGGALSFTASQSDTVTWPAGLGTIGDHTIEFWVRFPAAPIASAEVILSSEDNHLVVLLLRNDNGTNFIGLGVGDGNQYALTSGDATPGVWNHVVASIRTSSPTLMTIWVNGVYSAGGGIPLTTFDFDTLRIGTFTGSTGWTTLDGQIDDLVVSTGFIGGTEQARARYCPLD
jgi:hypothetical protein